MKIQHGFISTALIGFAAGTVRILQYILTIDAEGYYKGGGLSDFLDGVLVGLLGCGFIWSIVCGAMQNRKQVVMPHHFAESKPARVLFLLIAATSLADGIWRLAIAPDATAMFIGIAIAAGAIGWGLLGLRGRLIPLLGLLPILQIGAQVIDYFRLTYKYIQVSEYTVCILGLCALAYFVLLLMKGMTGADCTKSRLAGSGFTLLVFGFAAFMAPLAGGIELGLLFLALEGFFFCLLATLMLIWLPEKPTAPRQAVTPDPAVLNEYISEIPEIKEDEEDEL